MPPNVRPPSFHHVEKVKRQKSKEHAAIQHQSGARGFIARHTSHGDRSSTESPTHKLWDNLSSGSIHQRWGRKTSHSDVSSQEDHSAATKLQLHWRGAIARKLVGPVIGDHPVEPGKNWKLGDLEKDLDLLIKNFAHPTRDVARRFHLFTLKLHFPGIGVPARYLKMAEKVLFEIPASATQRVMVESLMKVLRGSGRAVAALVELLLSRQQRLIKNAVESQITQLHLNGGLPLGEEGPMSYYRLEILRLNEDCSQAFEVRELTPEDSARLRRASRGGRDQDRSISVSGAVTEPRAHPVSGKFLYYRAVRKTNPCAAPQLPEEMNEPHEVEHRGIIKRFTFHISPHVSKAVSKRRVSQGSVGSMDESPTKGVDDYIDQNYPCCVRGLLKSLPPFVKAHFPNTLQDDWIPPHMRDDPMAVLKLDTEVAIMVRFDSKDPLPKDLRPRHNGHHLPFRATMKNNPFKFEVAVRGSGLMPSLGQIGIKYFVLHAHATIWWDVFDKKMTIAIRTGQHGGPPPRLDWDVEASIGVCGLPLPDCIEDTFLANLGAAVVRSFNRINPINLDFEEMLQQEHAEHAKDHAGADAAEHGSG